METVSLKSKTWGSLQKNNQCLQPANGKEKNERGNCSRFKKTQEIHQLTIKCNM